MFSQLVILVYEPVHVIDQRRVWLVAKLHPKQISVDPRWFIAMHFRVSFEILSRSAIVVYFSSSYIWSFSVAAIGDLCFAKSLTRMPPSWNCASENVDLL